MTTSRPRRLLAALSTASLVALSGCALEEAEPVEGASSTTAAELFAEPANHVGEAVRVEAVVGALLTDHAFTIVPEDPPAPQDEPAGDPGDDPEADPEGEQERLVVVWPRSSVAAGDRVVVEGTVREVLDVQDLEERYEDEWPEDAVEEHRLETWLEATDVDAAA